MNILLTGASGFIGRNISTTLMASGHQVIPISRRHGTDFRHMLSPADWLSHLQGMDAVINCVGIIGETAGQRFETLHHRAPSALFHACLQAGIGRVLQISALGTEAGAFSAYHLSKLAADDYLRRLDLDWFVLRPSLVYGRGSQSAELFMRLAALPMIPVIGDGQQRLQPVHISDLVATVQQALCARSARQTLDIVGPDTFTFADWLQRMRQAQGLPPGRLLHLPYRLALGLLYAGRHLNPILQPDNLRMLQRGYLADPQPLTQFLGRRPLAAEAALFFSDGASAGSAP